MTQDDDTRDKFIAAIAERLTPESIAEAHVFSPIRQGGVESGVAVIAVRHRPPIIGDAAAEDAPADPSVADTSAAEDASRLTVYSAKYRLTIKGPERGKWEFAIQAEADAPLLTVDKVVRGVQQRSGDAEGPMRFSGEEFRALLPFTP